MTGVQTCALPIYGQFNGMQETENKLNGEKGEDIALDIYYADLIQK